MEAIFADTRNRAAALALDRMGSIVAGENADFLVLDANSLDNISNTRKIDRVYLRGAEVPRAEFAKRWRARNEPQKAQ